MKLLIMRFPPVPCYLPGPTYLSQHLISVSLSLCSSLVVRVKVSPSYKIRNKINSFVYFNLYIFVKQRENESLWAEW
jgi:hypothetical protein